MSGFGAIVLAGGGARRLGGADKPGLSLGGRPLLHRVLDAVADAYPRIVVGPPRPVPEGVLTTREEPPGGGPVAALAAGLALLDSVAPGPDGDVALVAVLAGDLPFLRPEAVGALRAAATGDAALYTDGERRQRAKPKRERASKRKPITRLPKPEGERGRRKERRGVVVSA
ncbi:MAG: molybdenum cofactor guanylyltransferase, partial [Micromonosporaceae bacterium]